MTTNEHSGDSQPPTDWSRTTNQPEWERYTVEICPGLSIEGTRPRADHIGSQGGSDVST